MSLPLIGVSMGDPAGIGPEILVKAANDERVRSICHLLAVGDVSVLASAIEIIGSNLELVIADPKKIKGESKKDSLTVLDMGIVSGSPERGIVKPEDGKASYEYIKKAISLAMDGSIAAVVTNPINKAALSAAGVPHAGHTEIFASQTGSRDYAMMIAHGSLRAVHVSTHVSIRTACDRVTKERVLSVIRLAASAVNQLDSNPSPIGVSGLNPHAGEGGLFGTEEIEHIIPAIEAASSALTGDLGKVDADGFLGGRGLGERVRHPVEGGCRGSRFYLISKSRLPGEDCLCPLAMEWRLRK